MMTGYHFPGDRGHKSVFETVDQAEAEEDHSLSLEDHRRKGQGDRCSWTQSEAASPLECFPRREQVSEWTAAVLHWAGSMERE